MTAAAAQRFVTGYTPYLGCDPEFFFERGGQVIGAEKVLTPDRKIVSTSYKYDGPSSSKGEKFVLDGVQVELNPRPNTCRANLGNEIAAAFRALRVHLKSMGDVKASFKTVVEVSQQELDSLSDKAKVFGCAESLNTYDKGACVGVDASTYLKRSAGGHIHLGFSGDHAMMAARERLVPILDVFVGNTCVLIDRDPEQAERRKVYGRAGEYRLPTHGVEYRTLSNFWLRAYPLMSMVMGLSRQACGILFTTVLGAGADGALQGARIAGWDAESALLASVDLEKVRLAINTNDRDLALENFEGVKTFITNHIGQSYTGIGVGNLSAFELMVNKVHQAGIEAYFPDDPMTHWCGLENGHNKGFESFLYNLRYQHDQAVAMKKLTIDKVA